MRDSNATATTTQALVPVVLVVVGSSGVRDRSDGHWDANQKQLRSVTPQSPPHCNVSVIPSFIFLPLPPCIIYGPVPRRHLQSEDFANLFHFFPDTGCPLAWGYGDTAKVPISQLAPRTPVRPVLENAHQLLLLVFDFSAIYIRLKRVNWLVPGSVC